MKVAFVFPGQGSQFPGMAKQLVENYPQTIPFFQEANEVLGFDILKIMVDGSADELKQTKVAQNAIFIYSVAVLSLLEDKLNPVATAGHSLGEFTALVATNALDFSKTLQLIDVRASAMQKACEETPSSMAAVLGLDDQQIESICSTITDEVITPANYNCPGQVVISGSLLGIERVKEPLQKAGARRVLPLPVGGAFHSDLMKSAKEQLATHIQQTPIHTPTFPIYQNINATPISSPEELKKNLILQLTGAVKWTQSIQAMWRNDITHFVEVGPGKVLQGLIKKIVPDAEVSGWQKHIQ